MRAAIKKTKGLMVWLWGLFSSLIGLIPGFPTPYKKEIKRFGKNVEALCPQRIQFKRISGFNLQQISKELNGRDAVRVTRPSRFGNPFKIVIAINSPLTDRQLIIQQFENYLIDRLNKEPDWLEPLRGKNLACFCKPDEACHADVLLEYANRETASDND